MVGMRRDRVGGEFLESIYSVLVLALVLLACVELGDAATAVDVYRLIQYDIAGVPFGSRLAGLNHHAGSSFSTTNADLSRTALILPVRELNLTLLNEFITRKQPLGGLLLLLPQRTGSSESGGRITSDKVNGDSLTRSILFELEKLLIHSYIPYPVYFAFENDKLNSILADIRRSDATGQPASATSGGYKLVVSSWEPKKVSSPTITNIQGWLPGLKEDDSANQLPTIAIIASYDTFGSAPALSVGSDSNGSGVVALLEIARLFSRLYSNPKTRGRYNLLFGLTSGGPYNYNGTLKWLRSFDQRVRESIDYAICLNSIGSWDNELWVHVSKPPENAYIKQVFDGLSEVAQDMGVKIGIKHKKINISNPRKAKPTTSLGPSGESNVSEGSIGKRRNAISVYQGTSFPESNYREKKTHGSRNWRGFGKEGRGQKKSGKDGRRSTLPSRGGERARSARDQENERARHANGRRKGDRARTQGMPRVKEERGEG
ncbi:nicalin-1-like [Phalaenopsis equestris]|uniref:nicalin-1-like n=1 Tax=Phalaenopsis equestris TaxID=78828 RepID=UPI0009E4F374|nr:nicalin-1-like [Phalaenopsis equestris]